MMHFGRSFLRIARKWTGHYALCSILDRSLCTLLDFDPAIFEQ